jgi:NitT/TauT family transport system permease protein
MYRRLSSTSECRIVQPVDAPRKRAGWGSVVAVVVVGCAVLWGAYNALLLVHGVTWADARLLLLGAGATYLRVTASLLIAALWTIPVGVTIGFNPKLAHVLQPITQVIASVPATALFPVLLLGLIQLGGGLGVGSIALMLLGTQWYIFFNVIAGAVGVPSDLREAAKSYHFTLWQRLRAVYLPSVFPYLVTGWVTATGGAWNASIVSEYVTFKGNTLTTEGLGSEISQAADQANFSILAAAVAVMSAIVVLFNRTVWRSFYGLAERRYSLDK